MSNMEEALRLCLDRALTFVAFRWKGGVYLWVQHSGQLQTIAISELDDASDLFLVSPFHEDGDRVSALKPDLRFQLGDSAIDLSVLRSLQGTPPSPATRAQPWDKARHAAAIAQAQRFIDVGGLRKVVLARTIPIPFDTMLLPALFRDALDQHPEAFVCLLNCPEYGIWLGASPERLIHAEGDLVTVDSIAGTKPWGIAPLTANEWGSKERDEQQLVTDGVRDVFSEHAVADIQMHGPDVLRAGPVAHLHTRLQGRLGPASLARLVHDLHPTPAVCGTPRTAAREFIQEHEPHDRGLYAGFWGPWKLEGSTTLHVNIRCLQAFEISADIHVGGGITAASNAEDEWRETEQKARTWTVPIEALAGRIT
jgi:isochorismate synthase